MNLIRISLHFQVCPKPQNATVCQMCEEGTAHIPGHDSHTNKNTYLFRAGPVAISFGKQTCHLAKSKNLMNGPKYGMLNVGGLLCYTCHCLTKRESGPN